MAATKTVLRVNNNKAIVRIVATAAADTSTISFADLVGTGDALTSGGTPRANIVRVKTSCASTTSITLTRNTTVVGAFYGTDVIEESDWVISDVNDQAIVVTFVGGPGMIIIELSKIDGYSPKFESATFGAYDNPTVVGS
jgi:hypothetical protein